ncbi:hypothetical protein Dda_8912 [Drechslerella dactyloides]|uniref:VWFA domain-containing protein n=1 Tax=Drechslerella dactyloides TaxID=74499 RepID=A0AAD6ISZ9_DREDA|nr:hypothetical protein Dda_8912 [Drechslerella dactyloides]
MGVASGKRGVESRRNGTTTSRSARRRRSTASLHSSASHRNLHCTISIRPPPLPTMSGRHEKHLERPLPATPSPRRGSSSSIAPKELKLPKLRDRNRLKKVTPIYKSLDRLTLSSSDHSSSSPQTPPSAGVGLSFRKHVSKLSSSSLISKTSPKLGDPEITPRPLNISKPGEDIRTSADYDPAQVMQSRWSTSTSDVASNIFRKDSKRRIFGLPISFRRRVKSEQMTPRAKVSSGFFGGKFGASKLQLGISSTDVPAATAEKHWQSSRASSSMTVRGADGALSDDDTPFIGQKHDGSGRVPLRRHTTSGNILNMAESHHSDAEPPASSSVSRHSSLNSSNDGKKAPSKGFFSLFPRPPKRDPSEVMQMLQKNVTMPLILESPELSPIEAPRSPLPVNLRASMVSPLYQQPNQHHHQQHYRKVSDTTLRPFRHEEPQVRSATPAQRSDTPALPMKRKNVESTYQITPGTLYTSAHKKPVLSHLDLQITADVDTIEIGEKKEIWAVVEVSGSLSNNRETIADIITSLDVVFLLDLTQNMSEQALTTMKNTVGFILENITGTRADNFGMAAFTSTSACEVLMPMVPCSHQAKHRAFALLDSLKTASDPFQMDTPISNVVRAACSMFMPGVHGKNKNLIILSAAVPANQNNMVDVCGFDDVKVHVIGVGCIYWPNSEAIYTDARDGGGGFCFPTATMDVATPDESFRIGQLQAVSRRFVRALRTEKSIGMMRNVHIRILPGENVNITAVIGKTNLSTLRPGERATVLVRMEATTPAKARSPRSDQGIEALEEGLYATLGMQAMSLLSVAVVYKHSLLPATTTLSTAASAVATIVANGSQWTAPPPGAAAHVEEKRIAPTPRQNFVRKALIQKVATGHRNPKDALAAVDNIARTAAEKDLDYCNVVRELHYQIRVWNGRRRGRVLKLGSAASNVSFNGRDDVDDAADEPRPFSFERKTQGNKHTHVDDETPSALSTPALTSDSFSVAGSSLASPVLFDDEGSSGSVRRFLSAMSDSEGVDSSPLTVVPASPLPLPRTPPLQQRPVDPAMRLWKRIEMAGEGEVGSIGGGSSIGGAAENGDDEARMKRKRRKSKRKKRVGMIVTDEGGGDVVSLRNMPESEVFLTMI